MLELSPQVEAQIITQAAQHGMQPNDYLRDLLRSEYLPLEDDGDDPPHIAEMLQEAMDELDRGEGIPWEVVKKEIDLLISKT